MNETRKSVIEQLRQRASSAPKRIVFPESQDPRVIDAALQLQQGSLAHPILIQRPGTENTQLPEGIATVSNSDNTLVERCATKLFENRKHKGLSPEDAKAAIHDDSLLFAATLVALGEADGAVAGSIATTANVIRAGLHGIGIAPGNKIVSSFFLMQLPNRCFTYADCGVVPDPNAEQLAEIAIEAARNHNLLSGEKPYVAMLSFSTKGSAEHQKVDKVRRALEIVRDQTPDLAIDGELQFDAAWVPNVAAKKAPNSNVAGNANVFIFPDLDSGNIAYKITERLAGATALGPLVQGLANPFMDLSRGCSVSDIVDVAVVAAILAKSD